MAEEQKKTGGDKKTGKKERKSAWNSKKKKDVNSKNGDAKNSQNTFNSEVDSKSFAQNNKDCLKEVIDILVI